MNALLMDVQIMSSREECASDMGQNLNAAATKDVQIKQLKEECASGMGQKLLRPNNVAEKDA